MENFKLSKRYRYLGDVEKYNQLYSDEYNRLYKSHKMGFFDKLFSRISKWFLRKCNQLISWHNQRMFEKGLNKLTRTKNYKKYCKELMKRTDKVAVQRNLRFEQEIYKFTGREYKL